MVKIPFGNKLYDDDGFDYEEFSGEDYDPSSKDPLRKTRKMDFIGGEMDELASGAGSPTPYGRPGKKYEIPFEGQQRQYLAPQRAVEEAIESAIDQEISNLEKAIKSADSVGEMKANTEIARLQGELKKELNISREMQQGMGETYETEGLRKRVTSAYGGKVDPMNVELAIEDAKPLPTTSKGKGPGIKNAEAIIKTGLESKQIPYDTLKSGEYSFSKSSLGQASVEKALREGAQPGAEKPRYYVEGVDVRKVPYDYREPVSGTSKGILGQATSDAGATYGKGPKFTGVTNYTPGVPSPDAKIQQLKQSSISGPTTEIGEDGKPFKGDFYYRETGPNPADSPLSKAIDPLEYGDPLEDFDGPMYDAQHQDADYPGYFQEDRPAPGRILETGEETVQDLSDYQYEEATKQADIDARNAAIDAEAPRNSLDPTGSRGRMKGKFAGKKISGNTVNSVTPDAPKAVTSSESFNMKKAFDEGVAQGMTGRQAQKNAERLARLAKIQGKGKGKGKLFTTLGAVGLAALIEKGNK